MTYNSAGQSIGHKCYLDSGFNSYRAHLIQAQHWQSDIRPPFFKLGYHHSFEGTILVARILFPYATLGIHLGCIDTGTDVGSFNVTQWNIDLNELNALPVVLNFKFEYHVLRTLLPL